jgi:hypothetical protein
MKKKEHLFEILVILKLNYWKLFLEYMNILFKSNDQIIDYIIKKLK